MFISSGVVGVINHVWSVHWDLSEFHNNKIVQWLLRITFSVLKKLYLSIAEIYINCLFFKDVGYRSTCPKISQKSIKCPFSKKTPLAEWKSSFNRRASYQLHFLPVFKRNPLCKIVLWLYLFSVFSYVTKFEIRMPSTNLLSNLWSKFDKSLSRVIVTIS